MIKFRAAFFAAGAILFVGGAIACGGHPSPSPTPTPTHSTSPTPTRPTKPPTTPPTTPATKPPTVDAVALTAEQRNAAGDAQDYLLYQAFSRDGLISQLSSSYGDGYRKADATKAVDSLHEDWNQQAVRAAKDYLSNQHFSKKGLTQQLESQYGGQFTHAQAVYGVAHSGL